MSDLFPRASGLTRGYNEQAVADFFRQARLAYEDPNSSKGFTVESIQRVAFPLVRGGFDTRAVDSALGRLEAAFIHRDRAAYIAAHGEEAWFSRTADEATVLYPRLLRPHGDRFRHPENNARGYACSEVDALLDRLGAYFEDRERLVEADLRFALFGSARGDKAYDEAQVDAYLGRALHVLMAVS